MGLSIVSIANMCRRYARKVHNFHILLPWLHRDFTVVIFPEGTRGQPEQRQPLKNGISRILQARPEITITPVFMYGLGKSLPNGEALLVPFVCEVNVGEALSWAGDRARLMSLLETAFVHLKDEIEPSEWL